MNNASFSESTTLQEYEMNKIQLPPLSNKYCEGWLTKNQWLLRYTIFRNSYTNLELFKADAKKFQAAMGKNNTELADRYRGVLLGLAIGDALGTTLEFSARKGDESHTEMLGQGPFNLEPGQWTDDTSMALCLAYSFLSTGTFDARDQMQLYVRWWREGLFSSTGKCFDIGNTVASALNRYEETKNPLAGSTDECSAGNGSLMRIAPVVLFYASRAHEAIHKAGESSETTHKNIEAIDACRYFAALMLGALYGETKEKLLSPMYTPMSDFWDFHPLCDSIKGIASGSFKLKTRDEIKSTGYVVHSLEAALWAFYNSDTFESGMIKAVNLAGDSDTIGAIYGQLAGAYYGELEIPFRWIKKLTDFHYFYYLADEFVMYIYSVHKMKVTKNCIAANPSSIRCLGGPLA